MQQLVPVFLLPTITFLWAMYRLALEKDIADMVLHTVLFFIILFHATTLYADAALGWHFSFAVETARCFAAVILIPLLYTFVTKKIGALYINDMMMLLCFCIQVFIIRSTINLGTEPIQEYTYEPELYEVAIYYNNKFLAVLETYSVVLLFQLLFCIYKSFVLIVKMKKRSYHFSSNFKYMLWFITACLVYLLASFYHPIYTDKNNLLIFAYIGSTIYAAGFVVVGMKYTDNIIEDINNEPILISTPSRFMNLAEKFNVLMDSKKVYTQENLRMEDVAHMLGTNRTYVAMMMKQEFDTTFSAYINERRIEEAKNIIDSDESQNIKFQDIAWQCGFSSISNFNKVFKQLTGMSPKEWEKRDR